MRRRGEFLAVQRRGLRWQGAHVTLLVMDATTGHTRIGITVTTKIGGAVERNRFKRRVREIFRRHRDVFPANKDMVVIARAGAPDLPLERLATELCGLGGRAARAFSPRGEGR